MTILFSDISPLLFRERPCVYERIFSNCPRKWIAKKNYFLWAFFGVLLTKVKAQNINQHVLERRNFPKSQMFAQNASVFKHSKEQSCRYWKVTHKLSITIYQAKFGGSNGIRGLNT